MFDNGMDIDRVDWIRDGTINALAYPRAAAAEFGVPVAVPADNLLMTGGTDSLADMVAGTERGLLLTTLWYIRVVDPTVLLLTGLTRDGVYLVEDGQVTARGQQLPVQREPAGPVAPGQPRPASARSRCRANGATGPPGRRCRRCGSPTSTCRRSARRNNATMHDPLNGELGRLVALAPPEHGRINALVRQTCAKTLSLPRTARRSHRRRSGSTRRSRSSSSSPNSSASTCRRSATSCALGSRPRSASRRSPRSC